MRLCLLVIACFPLALVACGGSRGGGSQTAPAPGPAVAHDTLDTGPDAGATAPTSDTSAPGLAADDCEALLEHIFAIVYQQQSRELPEAQRPSPEDLKVAKDKLRSELVDQCVGANREVFRFDCAMTAQTHEALAACMGQPGGN